MMFIAAAAAEVVDPVLPLIDSFVANGCQVAVLFPDFYPSLSHLTCIIFWFCGPAPLTPGLGRCGQAALAAAPGYAVCHPCSKRHERLTAARALNKVLSVGAFRDLLEDCQLAILVADTNLGVMNH
jgi:hypothetical protein